MRGLGAFFGGLSPPKPPCGDGTAAMMMPSVVN